MRLVLAILACAAAFAAWAWLSGPSGGSNNPACARVMDEHGGTGEGNPLYFVIAPRVAADPERCDAAIAAGARRWKLLLAATGLGITGVLALPYGLRERRRRRDASLAPGLPAARINSRHDRRTDHAG